MIWGQVFRVTFRVALGVVLSMVLLSVCVPPGIAEARDQPESVQSKSVGNANEIQKLDQAAAILYRDVMDGNIEKARADVGEVIRWFSTGQVQAALSVEAIHALSGSILEVQQATQSVQASPDEWVKAAANLRLATDALAHPRQPLWQQYYKILKEDVSGLNTQFAKGNMKGFAAGAAVLEDHYVTIRTAALIHGKTSEVVRTDSWISYVKGLGDQQNVNASAIRGALEQGNPTFNALFGREKDATALAPFIPRESERRAELAIGMMVLLVLTYVGYRKYRTGFFG
ncbi:sporulation protein YpjB [Paenibacillus peoriae]|uniref:sporulation protein YpjB n=1 Tax=Paenibacillus peoriae TaxID=59893 RepID=UPI00026C61D9|nr:sporulation protein YpjB [Paenibacillus peoriae]MEC0181842.1 sporulation protein YpjB [Paenibacillus peoriae]